MKWNLLSARRSHLRLASAIVWFLPVLFIGGLVAGGLRARQILKSKTYHPYRYDFSGIAPSRLGPMFTGNTAGNIGDMVFLNDVQMQPGPRPDLFVVSGVQGLQMLVLAQDTDRTAQGGPGTVDVKGLIRRLPALRVLRKDWKLSKEQIKRFAPQKIYIAADLVEQQDGEKAN